MINRRLLLPLLAIIIIATSCSSKFSLTKRRYMKGYHVDLVKNKAVNSDRSSEKVAKNYVKTPSLVEVKVPPSEALYINKNSENISEEKLTVSVNNLAETRNFKTLKSDNNLSNAINKLKKVSNNSIKDLKSIKKERPCSSIWADSGNFGAGLLYGFISLLAVIILWIAFQAFITVLATGTAPALATGVMVIIGVLIIAALIVVFVINGD